jgi:hypothetical protein
LLNAAGIEKLQALKTFSPEKCDEPFVAKMQWESVMWHEACDVRGACISDTRAVCDENATQAENATEQIYFRLTHFSFDAPAEAANIGA